MSENNFPYDNPWDDGVYGTGNTTPPKDHGAGLAAMLILVIFLSGIISVLSILNIQLFRRLNQRDESELAISFAVEDPEETESSGVPRFAAYAGDRVVIDLQDSPVAPDNLPEQDGLSLQEIYQRNIDSVVSITSNLPRGSATGTGVILSRDGYIVTNNHVVDGALSVSIQLTDEREVSAVLIGSDGATDLAVLRIEADDLVPAQFGDSETLRVGDSVVAIGDPLGKEFRGTMTNGIISAINRDVSVDGRTLNLIQTNAALNSGNSGGPLINCFGQVVGINTMKIGTFTDNAGVEGLGFAIPSTTVKEVVGQLISKGYVSGRPMLGVEGDHLSSFYQHFYRMPSGLYITSVAAGSPAAQIGIEAGDILMRVDDRQISDMSTLNAVLYTHKVGDVVTLTVFRGGYQVNVQVTLAEAKG